MPEHHVHHQLNPSLERHGVVPRAKASKTPDARPRGKVTPITIPRRKSTSRKQFSRNNSPISPKNHSSTSTLTLLRARAYVFHRRRRRPSSALHPTEISESCLDEISLMDSAPTAFCFQACVPSARLSESVTAKRKSTLSVSASVLATLISRRMSVSPRPFPSGGPSEAYHPSHVRAVIAAEQECVGYSENKAIDIPHRRQRQVSAPGFFSKHITAVSISWVSVTQTSIFADDNAMP